MHLHPLVGAGEAVLGDEAFVDHPLNGMSSRSQASMTSTNAAMTCGWVPTLSGAAGGPRKRPRPGTSSPFANRRPTRGRSQRRWHQPAACSERKRRMFIQDSGSRVMSRSAFGSSSWRLTNRRVTPLRARTDSTRPSYTDTRPGDHPARGEGARWSAGAVRRSGRPASTPRVVSRPRLLKTPRCCLTIQWLPCMPTSGSTSG